MTRTLEVLDHDDCTALLAEHHLGRLAVVVAGRPLVFPIGYAYDNESVVFRTDPGTKLYGAVNQYVAFEIDGTEPTGWSVVVAGIAELLDDELEKARLASVDLGPWYGDPKQHWLRIRGTITGRRIWAQ
jgi:nitroimidazol reductase NimA-like FMN-containing flavoprotein (pyridoxamine 5'-phosphate oxidase superfamily)